LEYDLCPKTGLIMLRCEDRALLCPGVPGTDRF
jgi:hypothetical protein